MTGKTLVAFLLLGRVAWGLTITFTGHSEWQWSEGQEFRQSQLPINYGDTFEINYHFGQLVSDPTHPYDGFYRAELLGVDGGTNGNPFGHWEFRYDKLDVPNLTWDGIDGVPPHSAMLHVYSTGEEDVLYMDQVRDGFVNAYAYNLAGEPINSRPNVCRSFQLYQPLGWISGLRLIDVPTMPILRAGEPRNGHSSLTLFGVLVLVADGIRIMQDQLIPGDANADGRFDQLDVADVLTSGRYITAETASWSQGDWNADGVFDQADIAEALSIGAYRSTRSTVVLPEPSTLAIALLLFVLLNCSRGRHL